MRLIEPCANFGCFEFGGQLYEQVVRTPEDFRTVGLVANLFMDLSEADHYLGILVVQ